MADREIGANESDMAIQNQNTIASLLHLTDFSRGSMVAYGHALRIALGTQGTLDILHVRHDAEPVTGDNYPAVRDTLSRWGFPQSVMQRTGATGPTVRISKSSCQASDVVDGVVQHLERQDADLVVMATHRRTGLDRLLHRSVAEVLSRESETGSLLVPYGVDGFVDLNTGEVCLSRILVPIDLDPNPQPVIRAVMELVESVASNNVEVRLLHIGDRARVPEFYLPHSDQCIWSWVHGDGNVVEQICLDEEQNGADLIAMTTRGHDGFLDILRGSTTEQVLQRTHCPVLSVHAGHD